MRKAIVKMNKSEVNVLLVITENVQLMFFLEVFNSCKY